MTNTRLNLGFLRVKCLANITNWVQEVTIFWVVTRKIDELKHTDGKGSAIRIERT
jgi:hypothetical protein